MTIKISKLVPVAIKEVWPMEATAFTPWLLANADSLGQVLGIDLELHAAEHKVGGFSLDLVGQDSSTDEIVIVENQFGPTDHRHLGQLLTYAGGTDPKVVVWIAESFRDEHRAALDWLNQRTDQNTRFFGVQVSAVTIEGAPKDLVAPLFDLVVQPNDWGKTVKGTTTDAVSARGQLYYAFWSQWLERAKARGWSNRKPLTQHWMSMPTKSPRTRYTVSYRSDGLLSELFFNHPDKAVNEARWSELESKRDELLAAFGGPLVFDALPAKKGCRIAAQRIGKEDVTKQDEWDDYLAWFEDTQVRLRKAITAVGGIPPLPTGAAIDDGDDEDE